MIRALTSFDLDKPAIHALADSFSDECQPMLHLNKEHFVRFCKHQLRTQTLRGWVLDVGEPVGLCIAVQYVCPLTGTLVVAELVWYVRETHRGTNSLQMFYEAERWAAEIGAKRIQVAHPTGASGFERFFERRKYTKVETTWVKLCHGSQ